MQRKAGGTLRLGVILLLVYAAPASAQEGAPPGAPVTFAPVAALPLQSLSGRFSSLNPPNRHTCSIRKVTGRVVSTRLILADEMACGQAETSNVLVNVELRNPADAAQMVVGRRVTLKAKFQSAEEDRVAPFDARFLIAENAELEAGDGGGPSAAFTR